MGRATTLGTRSIVEGAAALALAGALALGCGGGEGGEPVQDTEAGDTSTTAGSDASGAATSTAASASEDAGSASSSGASTDGPADSTGGDEAMATGDTGEPPCELARSGPIVVRQDGEVVENVRITADGTPGIVVDGAANVTIRNVEILHSGAAGIEISAADDVSIDHVAIEHTGAPASGENPSDELVNISCYASARPVIEHVRLTRGSTGIYLLECPDSELRFVEGHDFRGPFPRGQLVQWDKSDAGLLEDFSVVNPPESWPEDNVNVYQSHDMQIRRGLVDGNNSPSGVGLIFDGGDATGLVEDVDAIRMGNGCFSDYAGSEDVTFRRTRCRENICTDQGRGVPLSGALMWSGSPDLSMVRLEDSTWFSACNPGNIVWPEESFAVLEVEEADFTLRDAIDLEFCWE